MFGVRRTLRWLASKFTDRIQRAFLAVLASGPIPEHIAFVMDGNRRYARMNRKDIPEGHSDGFVALRKVLEICYRLDIRCVSAYAFAIENFKRTPAEVDALMKLAETKLLELCEHGELLEKYGIRLNVIGRTERLPTSVRVAIKKAEDLSRHNKRATLNLCMSYASRDEMTTAIESSIRISLETEKPITEADIDAQLLTSLVDSPPLDVLVRTSGVKRLSDFLLWQACEDTQLQFVSAYWPDIGFWDFVPIILDFQRKKWAKRVHSN